MANEANVDVHDDTPQACSKSRSFGPDAYDPRSLPDFDREFIDEADLDDFAAALEVPDIAANDDDDDDASSVFITALNDWRPVHQRALDRRKGRRSRRRGDRRTDETREGFVYSLLKWPLLLLVLAWIVVLSVAYVLTRFYIWFYEQYVAWPGMRQRLRKRLQSAENYDDWVGAAKALDDYLGNDQWRCKDEYAYYDSATVRKVKADLKRSRARAEAEEKGKEQQQPTKRPTESGAVEELWSLVEACVKPNFTGIENPRLYSQTYYGTKNLVQGFVDELEASLAFLLRTKQLSMGEKRPLFKHVQTAFGRTALCLSGGATFAYYHLGVVKGLLDARLLPEIISGTSGGALVAALVCTRTDDELRRLLVPALAARITACHDDLSVWLRRFYRTGARFDPIDWARRGSWFSRGSMTFREAYDRTGRVLNVTCVPSDPHAPNMLLNYSTSPDCVIWSAMLASAAVPGVLSPVVLMTKGKDGLVPYSFGHRWKDGSLRTDIPLKALHAQFDVTFSIVSQLNPHIKAFFFNPRGSVGKPVPHRRGRGWRGGFLGSSIEQFLRLDLVKWLTMLRHLELLPRFYGFDWTMVFLQHRSAGTINIAPRSVLSDFYYILSDPNAERLARMLRVGQQTVFPALKFLSNRLRIERLVEQGRRETRIADGVLSHEDLRGMLTGTHGQAAVDGALSTPVSHHSKPLFARRSSSTLSMQPLPQYARKSASPSLDMTAASNGPSPTRSRAPFANGSSNSSSKSPTDTRPGHATREPPVRSSSIMSEISRQSRVFVDDSDHDDDDDDDTDGSAIDVEDNTASSGQNSTADRGRMFGIGCNSSDEKHGGQDHDEAEEQDYDDDVDDESEEEDDHHSGKHCGKHGYDDAQKIPDTYMRSGKTTKPLDSSL